MQLWRRLRHGMFNNALLYSSPAINHASNNVNILHFCLVASLLHYATDFICNWIEVGVVDRLKICRNECRSRSFALNDRFVRWGALLLKDEKLIRDLSDVWQAATDVIAAV